MTYRFQRTTSCTVAIRTAAISAALVIAALLIPGRLAGQSLQPGQSQSSAFLGGWCAQGDPTKQCSISSNGAFLTLTNETGDTSMGNLQGSNGIVAPGWQFVTGTLSPNGSQINWSNGTYWARCGSGGGGGGHSGLNLSGTWHPQGNQSQNCSIHQRGKRLQLTNEQGAGATGQLTSRRQITSNWSGTTIGGSVSADGNRIDWDNGTYWIRYRLYGAQ